MTRRPPPRELRVLSKHTVSPHMQRVTLGGPGLAGFPDDQDGAYVKMRVSEPVSGGDKPVVRTYTVRYYRADAGELDIDFVLHEADGPAARWAAQCQPGDTIQVGGPGPKKNPDHSSDAFLFAGDMSALPAIGAHLEALPRDATGHALIEIIDGADRQAIDAPEGVHLTWLVNPHPEQPSDILAEAVKSITWPAGRVYAWIAGEFSQSLAIRKWLKDEKGMPREMLYASSYWQIGKTEDGHRVSKRAAADAT